MIEVSGELVDHAITAAAGAYGDDPLLAKTTRSRRYRRSLKAAALGLHAAIGGDLVRFSRELGIQDKSLYHTRRTAAPDATFWRAVEAAERAVRQERGPKAEREPVRPPALAPEAVLSAAKAQLEAAIPSIAKTHPKGATADQVAALTGLAETWARRAATALQAEHKCRWMRVPGSKGRFVLLAWARPNPIAGRIAGSPFTAPVTGRQRQLPPLRERILEKLSDGAACPRHLAIVCDAKELSVGDVLRELAREGWVRADPLPRGGIREQRWRLVRHRRHG